MKKGFTFIAGFLVGVVVIYMWGQLFNKDDAPEVVMDVNIETLSGDIVPTEEQDTRAGEATVDIPTPATSSIIVGEQVPGSTVNINLVSLPSDGWVVVHEVSGGVIVNALGAARRDAGSHEDVKVHLLRGTVSGGHYAVVLYTDNGDKEFSLVTDTPINDSNGGYLMTSFSIE